MNDSLPRGTSGRTARQVAVQAAREAGRIVRRQFGLAQTVGHKGRGNIVTQTDLLSEQSILGLLQREFPAHGILSEESPAIDGPSRYRWVVDPLDGTLNFASSLQHFAVSIALVADAEPVLGVVYDPMRRELFVAERGRGATLDGRRIDVGDKADLGTAIGGFDLGYDEDGRRLAMAAAVAVRPVIQSLRLMGSAVLGQAYVACGRFDLYFHHFLFPWDVAAAQILLREAGALVTAWDGRPATIDSRALVAANPNLHRAFLGVAVDGWAVTG